MGRCTTTIVNEFAVRPDLVRRAIAQHRTWIEGQLGVSLSDVVILESGLDIAQIGVELLLAVPPARRPRSVLLFDESTSFPEEPGFCLENSKVVEDPFEDLMSFFEQIKRALVARLRAAD